MSPLAHSGRGKRARELRQIGAHVRNQIDVERKEPMVFVKRNTGGRHVVAALRVADKMI